jgi:hypothetical protein
MNEQRTIDYLNSVFDRQIKEDKRYKIDKEIFNLTLNWNIEDWKKIRTKTYWKEIDSIFSSIDKKKYKLNKIKEYYESRN